MSDIIFSGLDGRDLLRWCHVVARSERRREVEPQLIEELALIGILGEIVFGSGEAAAHANTLPSDDRFGQDLLAAVRGGSLMQRGMDCVWCIAMSWRLQWNRTS